MDQREPGRELKPGGMRSEGAGSTPVAEQIEEERDPSWLSLVSVAYRFQAVNELRKKSTIALPGLGEAFAAAPAFPLPLQSFLLGFRGLV